MSARSAEGAGICRRLKVIRISASQEHREEEQVFRVSSVSLFPTRDAERDSPDGVRDPRLTRVYAVSSRIAQGRLDRPNFRPWCRT